MNLKKSIFIMMVALTMLPVMNSFSFEGLPREVSAQGLDASYLRFENPGDYWIYDVWQAYGDIHYTTTVTIGSITHYRGRISTPYIYSSSLNGNTTTTNYNFTILGRELLGTTGSNVTEITYEPPILLPYNFDGVLALAMSVTFVNDTEYPESDYTYTYGGDETITLQGSTVPLTCVHLNYKENVAVTRDKVVMFPEWDEWYAQGLGLVKTAQYTPAGFDGAGNLSFTTTLKEARVGNKIFP